jgi:hypothetical protein
MPAVNLFAQMHKFVPTPATYGKPADWFNPRRQLINRGILLCQPDGSCVIDKMPLLCQSDPAVNAPLDKLLKAYPADKFPQKKDDKGAPIVDQQGKPVLYTAQEVIQASKDYGCYNTSIATVVSTALANRAPNLPPLLNRTKEFDQITPSENASKEINQLAWIYLNQFLNDWGEQKNGKAISPFYFHEVVADLGAGAIQESCDPYAYGSCLTATLKNGDALATRVFSPSATDLTNERIIDLMKGGSVPMIAYNRHTPKVTTLKRKGPGKIQIPLLESTRTFVDHGSYHKVVFNGFQPGKYPLRIYDVGNGKPYNVRISSDLNEMKFSVKIAGTDKAFINRPFLIYEGDDEIEDHEVFFIDHYDWLYVRSGLLK